MDHDAALAAVMLSQLPRVGETTATRELRLNAARAISLADFFRLPEATLRENYGLPPATVARLCREREAMRTEANELVERMAVGGVGVWLPDHAAYPARWRERLDACPPIVFGLGTPVALAGETLAVLNSRNLSERAVTVTIRVVQAAAAHGLAVVSGGMKATHRIPAVLGRAASGRAIVLDRGLFASFGRHLDRDPFGLGPEAAALDADRTLVLSPFRLRDHAVARNGARRDALVAALADIVVAVSTRAGGEIERVCFAALDRGQCVLSWAGENPGLVAAGAIAIDDSHLSDLRAFLPTARQ
jgi:predicted Rossmann fold nucleotide-binding protein DprA/Smf involved in DNA uptake